MNCAKHVPRLLGQQQYTKHEAGIPLQIDYHTIRILLSEIYLMRLVYVFCRCARRGQWCRNSLSLFAFMYRAMLFVSEFH